MQEKIRKGFCAVLAAILLGFSGLLLLMEQNGPSLARQIWEHPLLTWAHVPNLILAAMVVICTGGAAGLIWMGFLQVRK